MAEYIKREDALEFPFANGIYDHEHANEHFIYGCESYREWMEQIPAADVVERKAGKWIGGKCNQCGGHAPFWSMSSTYYCSNYCPHCGAQMIGGADNV